jgi:hypothetical protein
VPWQKIARIVIAAFVIVFAGIVFYSMRQRAAVTPPAAGAVQVTDEKAIAESGKGSSSTLKDGKILNLVEYARSLTYEGGRTKALGVTLNLKDRDGRPMKMTADEC